MAGGKLTPRQKMINMMYLVLTALLALNVSQEVLNAFHLVNEGLQTSNGSLHSKNDQTYKALDDLKGLYPVKAQEYWDKAQKARAIASTLNDSLIIYKKEIIAKAGGIDSEGEGDIVQRDNIDVASKMFVEQPDGEKRGKGLQKLLVDTREKLLALVDPTDRANLKLSLDAKEPNIKKGEEKGENWQYFTFNHVPATAAVTILTKFQNDAISSEGSVIEYLANKIGKTDYKFTDLAAKIIAPTSYVLDGQQYKADIFLAAFNKGQNPEIFQGPIGGFKKNTDGSFDPVLSDAALPAGYGSAPMKTEDGFGKYEAVGSGVGDKTYTGVIRVKDPATNKYKFYPFEGKYQTAPKAVVVSPTKMNVLYIGVDNPMEISVPGVGQGDVQAALQGAGSLKKDPTNPANYIATVTGVGKCTINVSAKLDGKMQGMGDKEFRIKRIPDPVPMTSGKLRGGNVQPGTMKAQSGILALLENFDFDARFNVVSFEMVFSSKGEIFKAESPGPGFTPQMKGFMDRAKPKDIIFIDEIKVVGPDHQPRKLGQIAFTVI